MNQTYKHSFDYSVMYVQMFYCTLFPVLSESPLTTLLLINTLLDYTNAVVYYQLAALNCIQFVQDDSSAN